MTAHDAHPGRARDARRAHDAVLGHLAAAAHRAAHPRGVDLSATTFDSFVKFEEAAATGRV